MQIFTRVGRGEETGGGGWGFVVVDIVCLVIADAASDSG